MLNLSLRAFQRQFTQAIVTPQAPTTLSEMVIPGGQLPSPEDALSVYSHGYRARLTDALGETFEAVWSVLGDEGFFQLAAEYIAAVPSRSANLGDYGACLPTFLAENDVVKSLAFLPDLAAFEWKFAQVFRAPAASAAALNLEGAALHGSSCLRFGASLHLMRSDWAVFDLWQQRKTQNFADLDTISKRTWVLLYKSCDERIWVRTLASWEFCLAEILISGASIEAALDLMSEQHSEVTESILANFFTFLRSSGLITAVY